MSLQFVTGSSGAGNSQYVYEELLRESAEHPEKQYLVIVPEQFTMQTQKEILQKSPVHGLLNVDILSFNRLAWRVFGETGGDSRPVLEDTGKTLVVQRVVSAQKKKLRVLGKSLSRQGAVEQMKSLISELMQYRINPQELSAWTEGSSPYFSDKIRDVQTVYQGFRDYIRDHYLTTEEVPELLCGVIGKSSLVKDSVVLLDGFTGFTPVQNLVVRELLALAEKVTVVVTLDGREDPWQTGGMHQLFYMSKRMIRDTAKLAEETHTELLPVRQAYSKGKGRFADNPELAFLEQNLFRYGNRVYRRTDQTENECSGIRLAEAEDPSHEITFVAEQIRCLVRERGYHYRDFAVVTGDLDSYAGKAERIFASAEIPYFLDQKKSVMTNQLVEFIRSVMDMMIRNYSYESVFRYLRSGLSDFTPEETDQLENYVLAAGIRGHKTYRETFVRRPKLDREDRMLRYNELREKFLQETEELHEGLHERMGTARRKSEALYRFLVKTRCQEKIKAEQEQFKAGKDLLSEREYSQIWAYVMGLLDKIVEVLGDEPMKLEDFRDVLESGFQEGRVGLIPPGEDQVTVGDIRRTRLGRIRVLFFVGVNEGIIPQPLAAGGVLSETDREELQKKNIELSPTAREEIYQQRFYLYLSMTKPQDLLYLSFSRTSGGGKAQMPSYLISVVKKMFPDLEIRNLDADHPAGERLETPEGRKSLLFEGLSGMRKNLPSAEFRGLVKWMRESPDKSRELDRLLLESRSYRQNIGIGRGISGKLYGMTLVNSVTRLEEFAGCPYRHFLDYGLGLQEREEFVFTAADFGTIMHEALEYFTRSLSRDHREWAALSGPERDALADTALENVLGNHSGLLYSTARNTAMVSRLRKMLRQTVWALQEQLKPGEFRPESAETSFSGRMRDARYFLEGGAQMKLTGRIDRVDECVQDGRHYLKIIDYKTGETRLDLTRLYHGLQLQLPVYMQAVLEEEQKKYPRESVEPGAMFYYHIRDPFIENAEPGMEKAALLKELRPDGLLRSENAIVRLFDRDLVSGASLVIPVSLNKGGEPSRNSASAAGEDFRALLAYTDKEVKRLGSRMMCGETAVSPYRMGDQTACGYCPYRPVCQFDERLGDRYRQIRKEEKCAVLEKMRKAGDQEENQR